MYPIISLLDRSIEVRFESKSYSYSFSRRGGDGFQWTKLDRDALRRTFVRNQERLNGCEIGETIVRKVVIVVDLSKDDKYDFSYVFLWPHCVKLILPRGVQQSLSLFVFFFIFSPLPFSPFFPVGCPILLFSWRVHTPHPSPNVESFHAWKLPRVPTSIACRTNGKRTPAPETSELDTNRFQLSSRVNQRIGQCFSTNSNKCK